jgi:aryl-alcohol dehydrogenase-like predicted oxidoreductase
MRYRPLGRSGLLISQVVLGTARFGELADDTSDHIVGRAIELGISTFDTADAYNRGQSEVQLGRALGRRRDQVVICSKVGLRVGDDDAAHAASYAPGGLDHASRWKAGIAPTDQGLSRKHVIAGAEASLRRLGTDHIDLYQVHRWDPDVPIDETLAALDDLVHHGKVRYIGCSGYASYQLYRALWSSELHDMTRPISLQVPYSLLSTQAEQELLPACTAEGVGVLAFSVVAAGLLSGRYTPESEPASTSRLGSRQVFRDRYWRPETFQLLDRLHDLSRETGRTVAQLATGAVLSHPAVSAVVYGVSDPDQLADPVEAAEHPLSDDELRAVRGARPR